MSVLREVQTGSALACAALETGSNPGERMGEGMQSPHQRFRSTGFRETNPIGRNVLCDMGL